MARPYWAANTRARSRASRVMLCLRDENTRIIWSLIPAASPSARPSSNVVIAASGLLPLIPRVQRIRMGAEHAGHASASGLTSSQSTS